MPESYNGAVEDRFTHLTALLDALEETPTRPAFALRTPYRSFRWTAGEVRAVALTLAARLEARGVRPGDRVLLRGPDSPGWCAAFLGVAACGAVAVPLDASSSAGFVGAVVERVEPRAAIVEAGAAADPTGRVPAVFTFDDLDDSGPRLAEPFRAEADETAEIVFTSGTTATPRGVELSHRNLLYAVERIGRGFRKRERYLRPLLPMRFLCLVPLSHLFGQTLGLFVPIAMKSTGLFVSTLHPSRVLDAIRRERPLAVICVPRMLESLRETISREMERKGRRAPFERLLARDDPKRWWRRAWQGRHLRSVLGWRTWALVVGGAELAAELERFWVRSGLFLIQGYGMTEAAPVVSIHNPLDGKIHTLGRPLGGLEVRLAEDGEVLVRGPNLMKGYYADPQATGEALRDGWLHTGDLAERDASGRLYFKGRKKELIVTASGMNVHPGEVEAVLSSDPDVAQAVVFGARGPHGDEVQAAVIPGSTGADPQAIRTRANERLPAHQRLRRVTLWNGDDFPRTATGKVQRFRVAEAAGLAPAAASTMGRALARVRAGLAAAPSAETRLAEDLGLDSLEMVELLSAVEEEFGVRVDDRAVQEGLTVGDLQRMTRQPVAPAARIRMPRWGRRRPLRALRALLRGLLVRPLLGVFVRLEVSGREELADLDVPCLLVANHASMLDAPTVLAALPSVLRGRLAPAMATASLAAHFEPAGRNRLARWRDGFWYALAVLLFNAYPMPQRRGFRPSLEYTGELLDAGDLPLVFPEGRMSRTGELLPFRSGIGLLALETRARVCPIHLSGLRALLPPGGRWPSRGRVRVRIGRPFDPLAGEATDPETVTRRIEAAVRELA